MGALVISIWFYIFAKAICLSDNVAGFIWVMSVGMMFAPMIFYDRLPKTNTFSNLSFLYMVIFLGPGGKE